MKQEGEGIRVAALAGIIGMVTVLTTVSIALAVIYFVAQEENENSRLGCERGNVVRADLSALATVVQTQLQAAERADQLSITARRQLQGDILALEELKQKERPIDCEALLPQPGLIP
jgi:hypothetical protein